MIITLFVIQNTRTIDIGRIKIHSEVTLNCKEIGAVAPEAREEDMVLLITLIIAAKKAKLFLGIDQTFRFSGSLCSKQMMWRTGLLELSVVLVQEGVTDVEGEWVAVSSMFSCFSFSIFSEASDELSR
jgi:hypothetical protein